MATKGYNGQDEGADVAKAMAKLIAPLSIDQLETLTIDAIHQHCALLAKAEAAFESLQRADTTEANSIDELRETYTKEMLAARAQQMVLAALIERLGYIPRMPPS